MRDVGGKKREREGMFSFASRPASGGRCVGGTRGGDSIKLHKDRMHF